MTICASYLCGSKAAAEKLCAPCHASERLVLAINAAVEEFLGACWPTREPALQQISSRRAGIAEVPAILDRNSPLRETITRATSDLGGPVVELLTAAHDRNVYVTSGAWIDYPAAPPRWYCGLAWDISEDQTDYPTMEGTPA